MLITITEFIVGSLSFFGIAETVAYILRRTA